MFEKAKWIWRDAEVQADEYADFITTFEGEGAQYRLCIAAETDYNVYVNDKLAAFGQYADYPSDTAYDDIDLTTFVCEGRNELKIVVFYSGVGTQTQVTGLPGVIFELFADGKTVKVSDERVFSRLNPNYVPHKQLFIAGQLGLTYQYNARAEWTPYGASRVMDVKSSYRPRPVKKLILEDRMPSEIVESGTFRLKNGERAAEKMQNAELIPTGDFVNHGGDGVYCIVDLGAESAGFLDFDIVVPTECHIDIGYGEHLKDGRCRTAIGPRNFVALYEAQKGENEYLNTFRRFGCRYVQIFVYAESVTVKYLGLRRTSYPVTVHPFETGNALRDRIYDVCVNTLRQCMHEHYEDCPWREQAFYTLDSRNQMLCGYYAFKEFAFARASLKLFAEGQREDGLMPLCAPADNDFPIPSYTFAYFMQVKEYTEHSGDRTLALEVFDVLQRALRFFEDRTTPEGLTLRAPEAEEHQYWNFYEWADGLVGSIGGRSFDRDVPTDALINAYYSIALQDMAYICRALGKTEDAEYYSHSAELVNRALYAKFYNVDTHLFESYEGATNYHVLTNALCLLCGAADQTDKTEICRMVADNGKKGGYVASTLSMIGFRYDALLRVDRRYGDVVLKEIDRIYGRMLDDGATSFYETEGGADAFGGAGSLCHGWSAMAVYYYHTLLK